MDAALLHPSRFLKSAEFLGKDVTYTVASIHLEALESEDGKTKTKGLMSFKETSKLLVINRTNSDCFKGMFGRETDNWVGKRVTLYPAPFFDNFTKEHTTAVRVRGSPDIKEAMSVTIHLPKKKPVTVKMLKTGAAVGVLDGDALETELASIDTAIAECHSPTELDAAWSSGLGKRINALGGELQRQRVASFKARKNETKSTTEAPPP